jgi:predicted ATPase/class 3 adenylate cyclase
VTSASVAFLFTDVEGSTRLLRATGDRYTRLVGAHRRLVRAVIARHGGFEHDAEGDAFFIVFPTAAMALAAAVDMQTAITQHPWPADGRLRIRVGVHAGEATVDDGRFYGLDVHRGARICAAGHGGQILLSSDALGQLGDDLPSGLALRDLGEHRLKDFDGPQRLYQVEVAGLGGDFPPLRTPRVAPIRLPTWRTSFVDRDRERELARHLLADEQVRLLTLTGPGGTGKTRLAVHVAAHVASSFPDGVTFVPLAPVRDPLLVGEAVAGALEVPLDGLRPVVELLVERLTNGPTLLVMDNVEHLPAAGALIAELLDRTEHLSVLATSRGPLHLSGERVLEVPPLPVPSADASTPTAVTASAAAELFVARVREVRPGFVVDALNARAVAAVCARLEGLPLAVELAAARTRMLPVAAVAERLDRSLSLLTGGPRDQPPRLRSLHAAISWSVDLLSPSARELFVRLSVFIGGAAHEAVENVCGQGLSDVLELVDELHTYGLVQLVPEASAPRYAMLEAIREYAAEQLAGTDEAEVLRKRHALAFLELAETAAPDLTDRDGPVLLHQLDLDRHNMRAALIWMLDAGETESALRLVSALWRFWQMRGHLAEAQRMVDQVLKMPGQDCVDVRIRVAAEEAAGGIAYWRGEVASAERRYRWCLRRTQELGDPALIARSLSNLAYALRGVEGGGVEAMEAAIEALSVFTQLNDLAGQATVMRLIAILHAGNDNLDEAAVAAAHAQKHFRDLDRPFDLAWTLRQVGMIERRRQRYPEARAALTQALRLFVDSHDTSSIPVILSDLASVAEAAGDRDWARRLTRASGAAQATTGADWADIVNRLERRPSNSSDPGEQSNPIAPVNVDEIVEAVLRT